MAIWVVLALMLNPTIELCRKLKCDNIIALSRKFLLLCWVHKCIGYFAGWKGSWES